MAFKGPFQPKPLYDSMNHRAVPISGGSLSAAPGRQQPGRFTSPQHGPGQRLLGSNMPDAVQPSLLSHPVCSDGSAVRGAGIQPCGPAQSSAVTAGCRQPSQSALSSTVMGGRSSV